ncbi:MAG: toll/interleukin-1 receptor domain-containing protein, partial [Planctomycetota bacterium]
RLLREAGAETFLQDEDFGHADFMRKMEEGAERSRVITLLSEPYQASEYCRKEYNTVLAGDPANAAQRLVVFRVGHCTPRGNLRTLAYTDLVPHLTHPERLAQVVLAATGLSSDPVSVGLADVHRIEGARILSPEIQPLRTFTGRGDLLAALERALWEDGAPVALTDGGQAAVALRGMGGIGKSELARQYAWRHRERYAGVWWVAAETVEELWTSLATLARELVPSLPEDVPVEEAGRLALRQLDTRQDGRPWLIVYDNVTALATVRGRTPRQAHVLFTSRLDGWAEDARPLAVDVFNPPTATAFLLEDTVGEDAASAGALATALQFLPLALSHAKATCRQRGLRFAEYAARVPDLIHRAPREARYPRSVYATFQLARTEALATAPEAAGFLDELGFLAADQVPLWLFDDETGTVPEAVESALDALAAVALVRPARLSDDTRGVSLHRLVQEVVRGELNATATRATLERVLGRHYRVAWVVERVARTGGRDLWLPHAQTTVDLALSAGAGEARVAWVLDKVGDLEVERGDLSRAGSSYERALDLRSRLAEADPGNAGWQRDLSVSFDKVGDVLVAQGRLDDALGNFQKSLDLRSRLAEADPGNAGWQ